MYESGTRILDKYVLRDRIGSGAFGEVWSADSVSTGEPVAVKMERIQGNPAPTLQYESRVLQLFQNMVGIPRLRYFGRKDDMDGIFMVTELLGPSLEALATSHRLDMPADIAKNPPRHHADFISAIGRQMLQRLRSIHMCGMLHRDVKPDNFLFAAPPCWTCPDAQITPLYRCCTSLISVWPSASLPFSTRRGYGNLGSRC